LSVAAPVGLYLVASAKRNEADALGSGNTAYAEALGSYNNWRTAYYVSYAVPVTLAAATVVFAVWPRARSQPQRGALVASPRGIALSLGF
jgi:hypothetical protein